MCLYFMAIALPMTLRRMSDSDSGLMPPDSFVIPSKVVDQKASLISIKWILASSIAVSTPIIGLKS